MELDALSTWLLCHVAMARVLWQHTLFLVLMFDLFTAHCLVILPSLRGRPSAGVQWK